MHTCVVHTVSPPVVSMLLPLRVLRLLPPLRPVFFFGTFVSTVAGEGCEVHTENTGAGSSLSVGSSAFWLCCMLGAKKNCYYRHDTCIEMLGYIFNLITRRTSKMMQSDQQNTYFSLLILSRALIMKTF